MTKLCCVFNTPSLYRESIYFYIEKAYDCDWYFEDTDNKVKTFDVSRLKHVTFQHTFCIGPFYWVKGLLALLKKKEYQQYLMIGHSHNLSIFCFLMMKKLIFPKKKIYLWSHGFYGKESFFELFWKKMFFSMADELFIYGDYACKLMEKKGFDQKKLHAIHNSLSYDLQLDIRKQIQRTDIYYKHFFNKNHVIIFVGRLTSVKRLDILLEALYKLKERKEEYNLVLVGDGPEKSNLLMLVNTLGLSKSVWFYGECYDEQKNAELIYNADICVSPGNVGLTAIHALMFGTPIITHNDFKWQMPEFEVIQEGKTGMFFKYNSSSDLANTISEWFIKMADKRDVVRKNCYKKIDISWNPHYQIELLKKVIQ